MPALARHTVRAIAAAACLTLAACRESTQPETIPADVDPNAVAHIDLTRTRYVAGDSMSTTIVSRSDQPIGYNYCHMKLERVEDGEWRSVDTSREPACWTLIIPLEPGARAPMPYFLPATLPKGTYRQLLEVSNGYTRRMYRVVSGAFTVDAR